ncbi:M48 family metallopeptidase [Dechloromonas sp. HYN0024]|uniref:M48 family metallopeptidase n=1 Tax=Dechloromonas sp. HYN0024 TaxID=2231055 RepID=UPI000E432712|nr:SprT family zinc-dependent metalloprotease [Dechloromonas sp. HYN0024]AXS81554.1 M48 family peptidase [Dechloromonas sp. HYN0024]
MPRITPPEPPRSIVIAGQAVAYQLRRSQRRTIGLSVDHRGLRVAAPTRARLGDIESLIHEHGQWVIDKLAAWRDRVTLGPLVVSDGTVIEALGEPLTVTLTSIGRSRWQFGPGTIYLRPDITHSANALLEAALRDKARTVFAERLDHFAPLLGVALPPLRLSSARTRWGSCSHRGGIALNWRLVLMPLAIVDYVVCHELAHLKEMNHSPRFWSVVEQLCPDWKARRLELRQLARKIPQL